METNITEKTIAMRNGTEKMKRDREYWSEEEREKLRTLFLAGVPINEIAIILERSETAVYQQIQQMHLYVRAPESARKRRSVTGDSKCLCAACTCDRALCPLQERSRQGEEVT